MVWTEERRQKQREIINRNRPWEKSTGPRTRKGKARSSLNAVKSGLHGRSGLEIRKLLYHNREFLKAYREHAEWEVLMRLLRMERPPERTVEKSFEISHTPGAPVKRGRTD
ncbi:MAG: hypothetical protein DYH13_01765 [Alphaproteobacteria bacterium PRO2]|nr:hypothetical protein [Alphaproteobacteria bacterium PRO2]